MNDRVPSSMQLAAATGLAIDKILRTPATEQPVRCSHAQTPRDVIAFLDANRAYIEIRASDTTRGCILYEGDAWRAFRPDDSEIGEPGINGTDFGYPTLENALAAYIDAVSK